MASINPDNTDNEGQCEDCKRLRHQLTWTGQPPKCAKHSDGGLTTFVE